MAYEEADSQAQQNTLISVSRFFTRITEVLQYLVYYRDVNNLKALLPAPFFLPAIYNRPHLAIQRSGSRYDGKYYILDHIDSATELATEVRGANQEDFRIALVAFDEPDGLQQLIWQLDKQTSTTSNSTP